MSINIRVQPWKNDRFIVSAVVYSELEDIYHHVLSSIEKILKETTVLRVERVRKNERTINISVSIVGQSLRYSIYPFSPYEVDRLLKDKLEEALEQISRAYGDKGSLSYRGFDYIPFDISWFNTATDSFKKGVIGNAI
jgi:transposase